MALTANTADSLFKKEFVGEISGFQVLFFIVEARVFPRNLAAFLVTEKCPEATEPH